MLKWISEHRLFTVISGIVIILCIIIIISFLTAGGSSVAGRGAQSGIAVIQRPLTILQQGIRENVGGIFKFRRTLKENEKLKERVAELETENQDLQMSKDELRQLKKLAKSFDYEPFAGQGKSKVGRIIELDLSNPYVVFTIDIGTEDGIEKDDIVVDGSGLVGRIQECGAGYSKVTSILSNSNNISFKVLRKSSIAGVLSGDGNGKLSGYLMNDKSSILKGDVLVTSGIGNYPEGIRIGTVSEVDYDEDRQLKVVTVSPSVKFNGMQKVAVYYEY